MDDIAPVVDVAFALRGSTIPADHGYLLFSAISRHLPSLHGDETVGIHPVAGRLVGNRQLELTPASFGSPTSAALSAALWLAAVFVVFYLPRLFIDIVDPTSRQQRRERRQAQRARRKQARLARKAQRQRFVRREDPPLQERQEPTFNETHVLHSNPDAELPHAVRVRRAGRAA